MNNLMDNLIVCCNSSDEFRLVQLELFSIGINWKGDTKLRTNNYGTSTVALRINNNKIVAMGRVFRYKNNNYLHIDISKYEIVGAERFLRRLKLEKLNGIK